MNKCDILIPVFFFQGRDIEALIPLKYFLENKYKLSVSFCSVFDRYTVDKYLPKLVIMENVAGSSLHVKYAKYVKEKGISLISLISEGSAIEDYIEDVVWGHNKKHEILFDKLFVWTPEQKAVIKKRIPKINNLLDISGAMGFDRYFIYQFTEQREFLKKYHKSSFKYVVGYAGFTFNVFYKEPNSTQFIKLFGQKYYEYFKYDKDRVKNILYQTIKNHPDILFILKQHPGEMSNEMDIDNEWERDFDNVLFFTSQEPVSDIINSCNLWTAYESTTCLEAWLLKKPTIILAPSPNFKYRNAYYQGSVIANNGVSFSKSIEAFQRNEKLAEYITKTKTRRSIIKSIVYRVDGLNSFRTAQKVNEYYQNIPTKPVTDIWYKRAQCYLIYLGLELMSIIRKFPVINRSSIIAWYNEDYLLNELERKYYPCLKIFMKKLKL